MHVIRPARLDEVPTLNALIAASATELSRGFYTPAEAAGLIRYVFGVDTQLLHDQTYYAVEREGALQACGGWSARRTLFGGDQAKGGQDNRLDPSTEAARIRAFFVHPGAARQGLGRLLLTHCEQAALHAGFRQAELMATLPGQPFYLAAGYVPIEPVDYRLPDGMVVKFVRMGRGLE